MTGTELKKLRQSAGLTQEALAALIGWRGGRMSVYMAESGRRVISETAAIAIRAVIEKL